MVLLMAEFDADIVIRTDYPYPGLNLGLPEGTESVRVRRLQGGPAVLVGGLPHTVKFLVVEGLVMLNDLWLYPNIEALHATDAIITGLLPMSLRRLHLGRCHVSPLCFNGCTRLEHMRLEGMGALADIIPDEMWSAWAPTLASFTDVRSPCGV
jgi:hypothetical protein